MNERKLRETIDEIEIKEDVKRRIINNCTIKKKTTAYNYKKIIITAMTCVIIIGATIGIPKLIKNPEGGSKIVITRGLTIQALAASENGTEADKSFEDMKLKTKVLLKLYSPLMSSVPGYPFRFTYPDGTIELSADNGSLLLWEESTGWKVEDKGKRYTIQSNGTVYWSPLSSSEDEVKRCMLEIKVRKEGKLISSGVIKIEPKEENPMFFTAELTELIAF